MADNTTLPGTGDVIADEDISGVKFQKVKLIDSTAASTTPVGTTSNPLKVSTPAGAATAAKAQDVASAPSDVGNAIMAVRKGTPANTSNADGDYEQVQMSAGRVWVSATIESIIAGVGATNIGKAEDAAHADGDTGVFFLTVRKDAAASTASTNNDYAALTTDANGRVWANTTLSDGTNVVDVQTAGADGLTNSTNRLRVASTPNLWNGATWDRMPGNTSGTFNQGNIAHDGVDAGNPIANGARAIDHGTNPTAVAAGDRTVVYANRAGVPFVISGHPNVVTIKHTTITTAVTDAAIITVGAGTKIVVTKIKAICDNASTVFPTILVGFGATNTPTTTGVILSHPGCPAGGGTGEGDGSGIIGIGGDGDDLRVTTTGNATGNGVHIVVTYYTVPA